MIAPGTLALGQKIALAVCPVNRSSQVDVGSPSAQLDASYQVRASSSGGPGEDQYGWQFERQDKGEHRGVSLQRCRVGHKGSRTEAEAPSKAKGGRSLRIQECRRSL